MIQQTLRRISQKSEQPLLKKLFLYQILIVLLGMALTLSAIFHSYSSRLDSSVKAISDEIRIATQINADKWLAWKLIGLDETLAASMNEFKRTYPIKDLQFIKKDDLQANSNTFDILVEDNISNADHVIGIRLNNKLIESQMPPASAIVLLILLFGTTFCFILLASYKFIIKHIYNPMIELTSRFHDYKNGLDFSKSNIAATGEIQVLIDELTELFKSTVDLKSRAASFEIANQVAHDIRSPLTALSMLERELSNLPEETRILLRKSINRIRDIANDLSTYKKTTKSAPNNNTELLPVLLSSAVESIVAEKRITLANKRNIEIISQIEPNSYGAFAKVHAVEFSRILSNLINNSVESISSQGKIVVCLSKLDNLNCIEVIDNGCGISERVLNNFGKIGNTYGKLEGTGLGLYHAKKVIESWFGKIHIKSTNSNGTAIQLLIPACSEPSWFVRNLNLSGISTVVVIDDDESIHSLWHKRLSQVKSVNIVHLFTPEDFNKYHTMNMERLSSTIFLCDYEFKGQKTTGLELIKEHNIQLNSILVTSRFDDLKIQTQCARQNIKLIPKGLADIIPIVSNSSFQQATPDSESQYVLIDDDPLVHKVWQMRAEQLSINLFNFFDYDAFEKSHRHFHKSAQIFVDSDLNDAIKGEDRLPQIKSLGFTNISLATGYPRDHFSKDLDYNIVGKEPPF